MRWACDGFLGSGLGVGEGEFEATVVVEFCVLYSGKHEETETLITNPKSEMIDANFTP